MSRNFYNNAQQPIQAEKILSALSYLTGGTVGIIWLIVAYFKKMPLRAFLHFNIIQSIIISFIITAISLLNYIPFIGTFINSIFQFFIFFIAGFTIPIGLDFSLLSLFFLGLAVYTAIWSFMGKIPEIPIITKNIRRLI